MVNFRAKLSDVSNHPWVTGAPFMGVRPGDLMWFEDTNTCTSEYETSLQLSDFEKYGAERLMERTENDLSFSEKGRGEGERERKWKDDDEEFEVERERERVRERERGERRH